MIVTIASGVEASLVVHAAEAAPDEACGLLLGRRGGTGDIRLERAERARNVAVNPQDSFEIDPAKLLAAHREARGSGRAVVGHYHSHPNARGEPSLRDAARAVTDDSLWVIVADGAISAWQVVPDGTAGALHGRFRPVAVVAG